MNDIHVPADWQWCADRRRMPPHRPAEGHWVDPLHAGADWTAETQRGAELTWMRLASLQVDKERESWNIIYITETFHHGHRTVLCAEKLTTI